MKNYQVVILATHKGTARDNTMLRQAWERRLKEVAPHYEILSTVILKKEAKK